jgi:hypothetical protein
MGNLKILQSYAELIETRRKATRRNGLIFAAFVLGVFLVGAWLFKDELSRKIDLLVIAILGVNFIWLGSQFMPLRS